MTAEPAEYYVSADHYLEAEAVAERRHEYLAGAVYAMAGTTIEHDRIAGNIYAELRQQLRGKPCEVFSSEIKVRIQIRTADFYYYPDVIVDCGHPEGSSLFAKEPRVIFEVLSRDNTARIDRGEKLANYQMLPSLDACVLVDQSCVAVTIYRRRPEGWTRELLAKSTGVLALPTIDCSLPLAAIYERTQL